MFWDLQVPPTLTASDLHSLPQLARWLLATGRVFAVHQVEGQVRFARITIIEDHVFLHALQDQQLPPGPTTLQVSEVMPPSPPCMVFLDLSWPGSMQQRVIIHLSRDTPRGRQFLLLCTGQGGPSYANTRLFWVGRKGQPGECVRGGDYERNDGEGGAALLPELAEGEYWQSGQAGAVRGWWSHPAKRAQFAITTRDCQRGREHVCVFGEVVQGINTLVAAAQHSNITEVTVVDCGVVLRRY